MIWLSWLKIDYWSWLVLWMRMFEVGSTSLGVKYKNSLISSKDWLRNLSLRFSVLAAKAASRMEWHCKMGRFSAQVKYILFLRAKEAISYLLSNSSTFFSSLKITLLNIQFRWICSISFWVRSSRLFVYFTFFRTLLMLCFSFYSCSPILVGTSNNL